MNLFEYLDRVGQRRLEKFKAHPPRPRDSRILVGSLILVGYYALVFAILKSNALPQENANLVRDAMLVLGPVVGAVGQAIFRMSTNDETATQNTQEAFKASRAQAEATMALAGNREVSHPVERE